MFIIAHLINNVCLIEEDPDDNKFVDCAIVAGADYIVSEDAHFRVLEKIPFPKVNVILLNQFMDDIAGIKIED